MGKQSLAAAALGRRGWSPSDGGLCLIVLQVNKSWCGVRKQTWDVGGRDRALRVRVPSARLVQPKIWESWAKGCRAQGRAGEIFKMGKDRAGDMESPSLQH